jgi:flagellar assembly protein FliH
MPAIIKATDHNNAVQAVAFNFDDMSVRAGQALGQVRAEAAKILAKAQQDAAAIRKQAEAEGRKAGQAAVAQVVEAQLGRQLTTLLPALRQAIDEIRDAKQAWLTQWEKSSVNVAAAIASRVIRRELSRAPEIPLTLIREALELAAGSPQLRLQVNPADHAALGPQIESLVKELAPLAPAEIVADPEITAGGCRVETRFGAIDQQFETQLARIEEELT